MRVYVEDKSMNHFHNYLSVPIVLTLQFSGRSLLDVGVVIHADLCLEV